MSDYSRSRVFSGGRVERVLKRKGIEYAWFCDAYDEEAPTPRSKPISPSEIPHLERFYTQHKSISQLAKDLGVSIGAAQARATMYALEKVKAGEWS